MSDVVFIVFIVSAALIAGIVVGQDHVRAPLIQACEVNLPRTHHCVLTAIPEIK